MKLIQTERFHPEHGFYLAYIAITDEGRQVLVHEDYEGSSPIFDIDIKLLNPERFA